MNGLPLSYAHGRGLGDTYAPQCNPQLPGYNWILCDQGNPGGGSTVYTTPASGSGHSTRDAILNTVNNLGDRILQIWQNSQQLKAQTLQLQAQGIGPNASGLTGAVGSITTWMQQNPLLVMAAGVALLLYLAPSPRGRR